MTDPYQGDPKVFIGKNGSYLNFVGGQPTMIQGFENLVSFLLFTHKGWSGNHFAEDPIGSDFEEIAERTINLGMMNDLRKEGLSALKILEDKNLVKDMDIRVTNPEGDELHVSIFITSLDGDLQKLLLVKNGINWYYQAIAV